jgi:uncharacterized protein DUF1629
MDEPKTVEDLKALVPKGESKLFPKRQAPPTGASAFYMINTTGEFLYALPDWLNRPDISQMPRGPGWLGDPIPLSGVEEPNLLFNDKHETPGDYYSMGSDTHLLSSRLANLTREVDPDFGELRAVKLAFASGRAPAECFMALPTRVIDAVDISRTDVHIESANVPEGSDRYVVHVRYGKSFVLRDDELAGVQTFVEPHRRRWLWRRELFDRAKDAGCVGLRGVNPLSQKSSTDIRI